MLRLALQKWIISIAYLFMTEQKIANDCLLDMQMTLMINLLDMKSSQIQNIYIRLFMVYKF